MVSTTLSFHFPTAGMGHPSPSASAPVPGVGSFRYEVIFNLRFISPPVLPSAKTPSLPLRPCPPTELSHLPPAAHLDDGRRKRERSEISSSLSPDSQDDEEEGGSALPWEPSLASSSSSLSRAPLRPPAPPAACSSSAPSYRSGSSRLAVECSVDILQLYSATLDRLSEEHRTATARPRSSTAPSSRSAAPRQPEVL
jgi:hypothetical protein